MFDDYNGYFKGNPIGAPEPVVGGILDDAVFPFAPEGLAACAHPRRSDLPTNGEPAGQKNNTPIRRRPSVWPVHVPRGVPILQMASTPSNHKGHIRGHMRGHMRSIIALPKPEQETWVEPGRSRAKS
jgi:hypothetical protein